MTPSHSSFRRARGVLLFGVIFSLLCSSAAAQVDHAPFTRILASAVEKGSIDYGKIRKDPAFAKYLTALERARVERLTTDDRLAFWINAYNALVIRNVLDNPGIKRPTDVPGFFDKRRFTVAGASYTLNDIENNVIRRGFNEPLIHFGLVCAARSCPPILPRAYEGSNVRALLAANARAYLASSQNRYDASSGTLHLSKIFEWYRGDFGGDEGIRKFVRQYGTPAMQRIPASSRLTFLEYDWTLNGK